MRMRSRSARYMALEMMVVQASRMIRDGDVVFVGTGLPMIASMLAKHLHAPKAILCCEAGFWDSRFLHIPMTVGDSRWYVGSTWCVGQSNMFSLLQRRRIDVGFLGGAQVDKYGNINSTGVRVRVEDGYYVFDKRFEGSGGAADIASMANRIIIMMKHERRRFVERVDYITSPGWYVWLHDFEKRRGRVSLTPRWELGMWGGPEAVISTLGVMRFDKKTKEMYVESYYAELGVTPEDIKRNTGFDIRVDEAEPAEQPTERELRLLRERIDPERIFLRG